MYSAPNKNQDLTFTALSRDFMGRYSANFFVGFPAGVALCATAASRLRAPKLRALQACHVQCSSLTPAGVALCATAASRLRAPKLRALRAFHVQCSCLTPAGVVRSYLRRAAAGGGAGTHDLQPVEVLGACRSGRRRWGARSAVRRRGDVFLGACRRARRRGGLQLYQLRAAWGATGQLSGICLGLWVSASGDAAQSVSMFIMFTFPVSV